MKYDVSGIKNDKIKEIFIDTLKDYTSLHENVIILKRAKLKTATMQARPVFSFSNFFRKEKHYCVFLGYHIRDVEELIIAKVPDKVLKGWFAHEFGHVVDYKQHSTLGILWYGLRYTLSKSFKRKVENDADYIALKYGFFDEIIATKEYILNHENISPNYKKKLGKYYLTLEDVHLCNEDTSILEPFDHL